MERGGEGEREGEREREREICKPVLNCTYFVALGIIESLSELASGI
jgi:hypothetical protein